MCAVDAKDRATRSQSLQGLHRGVLLGMSTWRIKRRNKETKKRECVPFPGQHASDSDSDSDSDFDSDFDSGSDSNSNFDFDCNSDLDSDINLDPTWTPTLTPTPTWAPPRVRESSGFRAKHAVTSAAPFSPPPRPPPPPRHPHRRRCPAPRAAC